MTKQELIKKWKAKKIAIENDGVESLRIAIKILKGLGRPNGGTKYYIFGNDKFGWDAIESTDLPTIKATEVLAIWGTPKPAPEPAPKQAPAPKPDQTPSHYKALGMQPHDMLQAIHGPKALALHLRMSAFEYRMRAGYKDDPASDLAKALHCEAKAKELEGGEA